MLHRCAPLVVVLLAACAAPPEDTDAGVDAGLPPVADAGSCLGADAAACDAAGCTGIRGWRSTGDAGAQDGGAGYEYAGCAAPTERGCGTLITCATSPVDGVCWSFTSTCVPDGWATVWCGEPTASCPR